MPPLAKILYIDDNAASRSLVSRLLAAEDYLVLEASDPLSGIELAIETQPDLVLIDINMPNMTGREVAARLTTLLPNSILVAFTADVSSNSRERALAAGCVGFISKPLDADTFASQIAEYLHGKRETLPNPEQARRSFLVELVENLEIKVRQLSTTVERNNYLNQQNQRLIAALQRRQHLLEAAVRVSQAITSLLDEAELLDVTVEAIAREFDFYFVAIYLLDSAGQNLVLRGGSGEMGEQLLAQQASLPLTPHTNIGRAVLTRQPGVVSSTEAKPVDGIMALLTGSRSRLALPLILEDRVLGALSFHSTQENGFAEEDIAVLQSLASQTAIAINDAQALLELDKANHELLRTKTFEAIATATGETIHWVGNKAAPIPSSARRVRADTLELLASLTRLAQLPEAERASHPLWPLLTATLATAADQDLDLEAEVERLLALSPTQLQRLGGLESILEDLAIIEQSANAILAVKEDFIGPVRLQRLTEIRLPDLIEQTIFQMNLPPGVVRTDFAPDLPPLRADERQLGQVYNNLIKNAWEALTAAPNPQIVVSACLDTDPRYIRTAVSDNGPGVPTELLDKIWVSFFTTKGDLGGTGLGLSACANIVSQVGGRISVDSQPGHGATFTVLLPL